MKVFLHIGSPKTGTNAFQQFMMENRERFEADGVYYPDVGLLGLKGIAHHNLSYPLMTSYPDWVAPQFRQTKEESWGKLSTFMADMPDDATLVLSSEAFTDMPEESVAFVSDYFRGHDVTPIYVERDAEEFSRSNHEHEIFHPPFRRDPWVKRASYMDLRSVHLSAWSKLFDVQVLPYDDHIVERLAEIIEVRCEDAPRANASRNPAIVELMRRTNAIEGFTAAQRAHLSRTIQRWAELHEIPDDTKTGR